MNRMTIAQLLLIIFSKPENVELPNFVIKPLIKQFLDSDNYN